MERIHVDFLDGGPGIRVLTVSGSPFGIAQVDPVGGFVAGPLEAVLLNEGLQQEDGVIVLLYPVPAQPSGYMSQKVAGQMGNVDPRQYQKPTVAGNKGEVFCSCFAVPADEIIAGGRFPCGGAEQKTRQRSLSIVERQVLNVLSYGAPIVEIVILGEQMPEKLRETATGRYRFDVNGQYLL